MSTSEEEAVSEPVATPRIRGVKTGTHHGKYKKNSSEQGTRVISAAEDIDEDWKSIAKANGVATQTAYGWLRRSEDEPKQRGGRRNVKVNDA